MIAKGPTMIGRFFFILTALACGSAMAQNRSALINQTNSAIFANGDNAITGPILNNLLQQIIDGVANQSDTNNFTGNNTFVGITSSTDIAPSFTGNQGTPINLYTSPPANYLGLSNYNAPYSFAPTTGFYATDVVRSPNVIEFTTLASPAYFETGFTVNSRLTTGWTKTWAATTSYSAGDYVFGVNLSVYYTATNCTTANNEPSGTGTTIDGTCSWLFQQTNIFYGKAGSSFFTDVSGANAPDAAWNIYEDFVLESSKPYGHFWAAHEIAVTNYAHAAVVGTDAYYGLLIDGFVGNAGLAGVALAPQSTTAYGWHIGFLFQSYAASDETIWDQGNSNIGYLDGGTHSAAIELLGTYANYAILGTHFAIVPGGQAIFTGMTLTPNTPPTSSYPCTAGQIESDATYFYFCKATNTWLRVAGSSF